MANQPRTWFITGASTGLGRAIAECVLARGEHVAATFRGTSGAEAFTLRSNGSGRGIVMDLRRDADVERAVAEARELTGSIDVVVNNAGYCMLGAAEELSLAELRDQMEVNFFGMFRVLKAVLPEMRKRRSGHIVQVSSAAGILAAPGMGAYNASKFAMEGLSEALATELKPLGIRLTIVEPGPLRTDFGGRSAKRTSEILPEYDPTAGELIRNIRKYSGRQDGDPARVADIIYDAVTARESPLRLPLGQFALNEIRGKISMIENDIRSWGNVIFNTSFDS